MMEQELRVQVDFPPDGSFCNITSMETKYITGPVTIVAVDVENRELWRLPGVRLDSTSINNRQALRAHINEVDMITRLLLARSRRGETT